MILTKKILADIEETAGHSCEAGVLAGRDQGDITIRVWAEHPDGQMRNVEYSFTRADYMKDMWDPKLAEFKQFAKEYLDKAFAS